MTSLARQLQKLAIPGQPSLRQVVSKKRPSLLFDAKEAADIDIETIHALGSNGLEGLISIDESFAEFETSLFQENCKEFERTVQTKEVLEDLDQKIGTFLRKLSPYFLLRPAQKCLEWLIRAFRVNSFNVDLVMECILPYYETNLFARVVQLLPLRDHSSIWHWLRPIQKAGSPLSKLTLIQHCISVPSFLTFIYGMVSRSLKVHKASSASAARTIIAFYSSTVLSVIEKGGITEELVSCLLPSITKGVKSSNLDYRASSYIIVSQMASMAPLEGRLCTVLLESITKHLGPELVNGGLGCVAVICHTQNITCFTNKSLKHLLKVPSLVTALSDLCHRHNVSPLLQLLLNSLLEMYFTLLCEGGEGEKVMGVVMEILDEIQLDEDIVASFISCLLERYVSLCEQLSEGGGPENTNELKSSVTPLAQSLDSKYPKVMDRTLETAVVSMGTTREPSSEEEEEENATRRVEWLQEFVTLSLPGSRHQILSRSKSSSTLVLSIYHPHPSVRTMAIKQLGKSLKHKKVTSPGYDSEFVSSALLGRLADDDPTVAIAVLDLGAKTLFKHLAPSDIIGALMRIVTRRRIATASGEWQSCALKAVEILTSQFLLDSAHERIDDIIVAILPLLFVGRHGGQFAEKVAGVLSSSPMAGTHPLLAGMADLLASEAWQEGCDSGASRDPQLLAAANEAMFSYLGRQLGWMDLQSSQRIVSKLFTAVDSTTPDDHTYFLLLAVLGVAMATAANAPPTQLSLSLRLLDHIERNISVFDQVEEEVLLPHDLSLVLHPLLIKHPNHSLAHLLLLLWLLNTITKGLPVPVELCTMMWLEVPRGETEEQLYYHCLLSLFTTLTHCVDTGGRSKVTEHCRHLLQQMIQRHFSGRGALLRFLAMIWTAPIETEPGQGTKSHSNSRMESGHVSESHSHSTVTIVTQARSLCVAGAYLRSLDAQTAVALMGSHCPVVPSLLVPLMSPYKTLRDSSLSCLSVLQTAITGLDPTALQEAYNTNPLIHLIDTICKSKLEISTDPSSVQQLLWKLFNFEADFASRGGQSPGRKKSRRKVELKTKAAILEAILQSLLMHVVIMGASAHVQSVLLKMLVDVDHQVKLNSVLPLLGKLLDKLSQPVEVAMETDKPGPHVMYPLSAHEGLVLQLVIGCYTPSMAPLLQTDTEAFQLFLKSLGSSSHTAINTLSAQELAMNQVVPEFFAGLQSTTLQQELLRQLLDLLLDSQRSRVITLVKELLRKLPLSAELVITELNRHVDQLGEKRPTSTPSKRPRHSHPDPPPDGAPRPWMRVTVLLEVVQGCCLLDCHLLAPHLFNIISRSLEAEEIDQSTLEYAQQLLLASLFDLCTYLSQQGIDNARALLPESQFNVELVVQCVRLSTNPQTHHHALLLLGTAAAIFPSRVLHNVMPIFTFMGANIMRQDDQYSFQVITKTIDTVIPALVKSGSAHSHPLLPQQPQGKVVPTTIEGVVTEIIRVFVDAVPHVPGHRRLPLFSHLLATIGPPDYLHAVMGLLTEKHVVQTSTKDQTPKEALIDSSFTVSLALEFSPPTQVLALLRLVEYLDILPQEKPTGVSQLRKLSPTVSSLFNVAAHTPKQLRQFKTSTLSLAVHLLSSKDFINKVSSLSDQDLVAMETAILRLLQCVLGYIGVVSKARSSYTEGEAVRFWEELLKRAYSITDKVISLLTLGSFIEIISQLVKETGGDVQRKTIGILNTKLEDNRTYFSEEQEPQLLKLVKVLVGVSREASSPPANQQAALHAISLLAKRLATKYNQKFVKVAHKVISMMMEGELSPPVHGSALLCTAELSGCLGPHLLPLLPTLMPCILDHVGETNKSQQIISLGATTALSVIVQTLPMFLSSYTNDILIKICQPHLVISTSKDSLQLVKQAAEVREKVASAVPARTLLPAYGKCYPQVVQQGKDSVTALLSMLSGTISSLTKDDVKAQVPLLTELFVTSLDYRVTQEHESLAVVLEVETCCLQAFTDLVVKLSETSFRPFFLKLLNWATHSSSPRDRTIVFYHLADCVAEKLKTLFLLFAGHIVKSAATLLDNNNEDKQESSFFPDDDPASEKACLLLSYVLGCLGKCFLYDRGSFLTKERFDTLLHPLVDQVTNCLGGVDAYRQRVETHLVPCLAHFGVAARKDTLWKKLNYQLLLKTRHSNPQVRFAVLKVLQEFYTKLGEEYMVLLPETIPFLAELMEDESVEVEQQTKTVITAIEGIIGESIQQYF